MVLNIVNAYQITVGSEYTLPTTNIVTKNKNKKSGAV